MLIGRLIRPLLTGLLYTLLSLPLISHGVYVISSTPKLPIAIFVFHIFPSFIDHQTAFPFQKSHETAYAYFGRYLHKYMYMIRTHLCLYYAHSFPFAQFSQYYPYFQPFFSIKYFPSVLRCPNYMIFAVPTCM